MTGSTPPTPEQLRELNRILMEKMLSKAASDERWKQRLLDDPEAALREANFQEAERLREAFRGAMTDAEVTGQTSSGCTGCFMASLSMVTGY